MEINQRSGDVLAVVTKNAIKEGLFVCLADNSDSYDFGSRSDLLGAKLPETADEAARAKFILTWPEDNRSTPIYDPMPSMDWATRGGWGNAANVPFDAKVYLTQPGHQNGLTIPSGVPALAYGRGIYTVQSGMYVSNAGLKKGALLTVGYSGDEKGMLKLQATMADAVVGIVVDYVADGDLTVDTMHF